MRDLLAAMLRFSWSMSRLGARQAAEILSGREDWDRAATASFETVRHAAEEGMSPWARSLFQAGNQLQRGAVDLAFDLTRQALDPRAALDLARRAAAAMRGGQGKP